MRRSLEQPAEKRISFVIVKPSHKQLKKSLEIMAFPDLRFLKGKGKLSTMISILHKSFL